MSYGTPDPYRQWQAQPYGSPFASMGKAYYPPGTVKNYVVESILALIFCGHLLAIPAVIFACQVDGKLAQGDYQGAVEASNNARMWLMIAVGVSVGLQFISCCVVFPIFFLIGIAGGAAGA